MTTDCSETSVVIPCYREDRYLREAMDSVAHQTCPACELIVVDDGSPEPIPRPDAWGGTPLVWVRTDNRGLGAARNEGLRRATGKFVAFLDADDFWEPEKLRLQQETLNAQPEAVGCYTRCVSQDGFFGFGPYPPRFDCAAKMAVHLWRELFFPPSTLLVRRELFQSIGGFAEGLTNGEDLEAYVHLLAHGLIVPVDEPLVWYRIHDNQVTKNEVRRVMGGKQARKLVLEKHSDVLRRGGLSPDHWWDAYRESILLTYYRRDFAAARVMLWEHWREHPTDLELLRYALISLLPSGLVRRLKDG